MTHIPLIKPYMTDTIKQGVMDVLSSGLLTEGAVTQELEVAFSTYLGVAHTIAVTSCTTGLELAVRALQLQPGDEVIVPDYTYPATVMAVHAAGAIPVIVDVEQETGLMSPKATEAAITPKTRAMMPVSLFGCPLDYTWIHSLKEKYSLYVIEDAACSIGAECKGGKVGTLADISVFSLHPRKFITSGEGGLVTTNNDTLALWMRSYKRFGIADSSEQREGIHFVRSGTNLKLSNIHAAIALGQLKDIALLMEKRQLQVTHYRHLLEGVEGVSLPYMPLQGLHSWQTFYITVSKRDFLLQALRTKGIEVQIGTYSMHMQEAFQKQPYILRGSFEGSRYCYEHILALPLYHDMTQAEQEYVVDTLQNLL